ncbi:MAG: Tetratricopeptide TPR3 [Candidatus Peregrinibacteria bacterium Gr01-1014_25]|nr:MAG: Tetratricopeptide TPR3 [Candidatus Peregrinibacteria bacterium Gr01-1014_25]
MQSTWVILFTMADPATPPPTAAALTIPEEIKQKFPEILQLILGSESMNTEERQYWINILPIMTPEQLKNLQEILVNEREQLKAIDAKYAKEVGAIGQEQFIQQIGSERRKRREKREQAESSARQDESSRTEDVLKEIEGK